MSALKLGTLIASIVAAAVLPASNCYGIQPNLAVADDTVKPWVVKIETLRNEWTLECSGILIDKFWALTARHCVDAYCSRPRGIEKYIRVTLFNGNSFAALGLSCYPAQEEEEGRVQGRDVALIRISKVFISEGKLPRLSPKRVEGWETLQSVGWSMGTMVFPQIAWQKPRSLMLSVIPTDACNTLLSDEQVCPTTLSLTSRRYCAWKTPYPETFFGLNPGDSGGPSIDSIAGRPVIAGLAVEACAKGLALFEDLSIFREWIAETVCNRYWLSYNKYRCLERLGVNGF